MLKIMQYFILKYRAEIKELNLLINDEEYRDEIRYRIKQVNSNNEEFKSSPDSCVKCYTMFYHFYLSKLMYFLEE